LFTYRVDGLYTSENLWRPVSGRFPAGFRILNFEKKICK
jgi:hypothetical protein